jgi:uncharacterized membrane protein
MLLLEYRGNLHILLLILYVIQLTACFSGILITAISSRDKQAQENCWYSKKEFHSFKPLPAVSMVGIFQTHLGM